MATPSPWRQRLLCSLTGQLQLATYIAVFLGFSGASVASLWLNQRTLGLSTEEQLRANAKALERHLLADRLLGQLQYDRTSARGLYVRRTIRILLRRCLFSSRDRANSRVDSENVRHRTTTIEIDFGTRLTMK